MQGYGFTQNSSQVCIRHKMLPIINNGRLAGMVYMNDSQTWWSTNSLINVTQHIEKIPVVRRLDFELWWCKVKISQNIVPKSILRFHIFWNLQYLMKDLVQEQCFNVKMDLWTAKTTILCTDSQILRAFFNFSPIFYDILIKTGISQERNVWYQEFLHQNWADRTAI